MKQFVSTKQSDTTKQNQEIQNRIKSAQLKLLDIIHTTLDDLTRKPEPFQPTLPVFRRNTANTLGLWQFCPQNRCRRSHCCRGEPLNCLYLALPLMPPDAPLFDLLKKGQRVHAPRQRAVSIRQALEMGDKYPG
jgi:hypothetical protein